MQTQHLQTVLLTGPTGYIGSRLLARLSKESNNVRCIARNPEYLMNKNGFLDLDIRRCDLLEKETVNDHFEGVDVAYYLVHSLNSGKDFREKELTCANNFLEACVANKVKKIVYLGGLASGEDVLSQHLDSRMRVGNVLRSSEIPCLEFQASIIIGSGGLSFEIIQSLVKRLPAMITPKWVSSLSQPIGVDDVIEYLAQSKNLAIEADRIIQIGGPDQISYKELMKEFGRQAGYKRAMISVPVLTPRLSSLWLGLVTPAYARAGRKLIDSLTSDSIVTDTDGQNLFNINPISYKEAIKYAIKSDQKLTGHSRWYDALSSGGKGSNKPEITYKYKFEDHRNVELSASKKAIFKTLNDIGGRNGWFFANYLWKIRGWIDLILGGVGMRRTRMFSDKFVVGDTLDWWRISKVINLTMVELTAEMRLPGKATLSFKLDQTSNQTSLTQTASFHTNTIFGCLYWIVLYPLHAVIFRGMLNSIAKKSIQ